MYSDCENVRCESVRLSICGMVATWRERTLVFLAVMLLNVAIRRLMIYGVCVVMGQYIQF